MEPLAFEQRQACARRARRLRNRALQILARKALAGFRAWKRRRGDALHRAIASRELRSLSDRMLRDIGLQRGDLARWG